MKENKRVKQEIKKSIRIKRAFAQNIITLNTEIKKLSKPPKTGTSGIGFSRELERLESLSIKTLELLRVSKFCNKEVKDN